MRGVGLGFGSSWVARRSGALRARVGRVLGGAAAVGFGFGFGFGFGVAAPLVFFLGVSWAWVGSFFSVVSAAFLFLETLEALLMVETLLLTEALSLLETCSGETTAWLAEASLLGETGETGERETADLGEESGRFKLIWPPMLVFDGVIVGYGSAGA